MRLTLLIVFILSLAGCSSGSSSDEIPEPKITIDGEISQLFNSSPIVLQDSVSYYSNACNDPSFQFLIPVNINDDNFIDFIAHFWCDTVIPAEVDIKDVPDILIAYVSDINGTYYVDNLGVFNELYPKLGGASRKYVRGDINEDGKDDFAFAMNAEDGRAAYDHETHLTNYAYPAVLLSSGSKYVIHNLGNKDWGHSVQIKNNEVLFGGHTSQSFKYENNDWIDISDKYNHLSFASFLVFDDFIINSTRKENSQGLELVKNNVIISSIMNDETFKVNFENWNNAGKGIYQKLGVYKIRGEYYFDGIISEMCKKDQLIVAAISASKPINRDIVENEFYSEAETSPVFIFTFFEIINNELHEKDIKINGEEINHNFNFFDCFDVNNDEKKDLVAQVFSQTWNTQTLNNKGVPEIYINSPNGYYNLDTSTWPNFSLEDDSQGYLYDVDHNGTHDLILFPLKVNDSANIEIYLSNRNIID
tara:strand:- start:10497 stop:11924 length:1428 start_codon:yes stop_codon:yes gene_type:complete